MIQILIQNEEEMLRLGELLGKRVKTGDLLFLFGELGAGKTTLAKGIALGMGIKESVTSPTFQLKKTYFGDHCLNHLDLYRLEKPEELEILEPEEMIVEGVTLVEWGELLLERLQTDHLKIMIELTSAQGERLVRLSAAGVRYCRLLEEFNHVDLGN